MNYRIVNGSISYGAETILEEINFEIKEKDKIAIIGRNGAGKTTFLNAIIDNDILEEGIGEEKFHVYKQGNPVIGYLQQMNFENSNKTMLEEILEVYEPILNLENRIQEKERALQEKPDEKLIKEYTNALEQYEIQGGYLYKKEYETAIKKFGFKEEDKQKKVSEFSGGQRTKIAFLKLLLSKPDILLLDEPTNHMDIVGKESLENILKEYTGTLIFVSHDRYFVNKLADCMLEFENGKATFYNKNYQEFLEYKENQKDTIDEKREVEKNTKQIKDKKKENNPYFIEKEKNRIQNKMNKIEEQINDKEKKIQDIEKEMTKEEICSDYIKLNELQEEIQKINQEIEEKMQEWENLNDEL